MVGLYREWGVIKQDLPVGVEPPQSVSLVQHLIYIVTWEQKVGIWCQSYKKMLEIKGRGKDHFSRRAQQVGQFEMLVLLTRC